MRDAPNNPLTIRELAAIAGVTPRTIRYYVSEGLLPPPGGAGQRRTYSEEHVLRLQAIRKLKEAYLPLAEIRRRLERVSPDDLRRALASGGPTTGTPSDDVEDLVTRIATLMSGASGIGMSGGPSSWTSPVGMQRGGVSPRMMLGGMESPTSRSVPSSGVTPTPPAVDVGTEPLWRRVTLGPGVELHFQVPSDRRREAAIRRLIDIAATLLGIG